MVHMPANMPELKSGASSIETLTTTIEILEDSSLRWNDNHLGPFNRESIAFQVEKHDLSRIVIIPRENAPAGVLVELLDQLRLCGVENVVFGGHKRGAPTVNEEQ